MSISFMDLFKELDVGDSLLVVGDDALVLDTHEGVAVLKVAVHVLPMGFVMSRLHSSELVSVTRSVVGRLVVGREESG
jgi:fumarate reductase subunit D